MSQLTNKVADIIRRSTITGTRLFIPAQLDRTSYVAVNKVIAAAGGKWNTKAQAHIFDGDPRHKLGLMLETGVVVDEKKREKNKFQAFYTPPDLAAYVAEIANVSGEIVYEPSAGGGSLADACLAAGAKKVECVELNPASVSRLRQKGYSTIEADFLTLTPKPYRSIVINPPFTRDQDITHVQHALRSLTPGGVLTAIMLAKPSRPKFAALIANLGANLDHEIEDVPAGAFKDSGTSVATIILRVRSYSH